MGCMMLVSQLDSIRQKYVWSDRGRESCEYRFIRKNCHHTSFATNCGRYWRISLMHWNTSTLCSSFNLSRQMLVARNVPVLPAPLLERNYSIGSEHFQGIARFYLLLAKSTSCRVWQYFARFVSFVIGPNVNGRDDCLERNQSLQMDKTSHWAMKISFPLFPTVNMPSIISLVAALAAHNSVTNTATEQHLLQSFIEVSKQ